MSTTSTVPVVIDTLVAGIGAVMADLGQPDALVAQVWPGPDAKPHMLFLGTTTWEDYRIATVKAGRKQRDENYEIAFELWALGGEGTAPADPSAARDNAFAMLAAAEDVLADDPNIGLGNAVQWIEIRPKEAEPRTFEKGWIYRITGAFVIHARLS